MSIETNKTDFEIELDAMKNHIDVLDSFIETGIMDDFKSVINEYERHLSSDIETIISENHKLKLEVQNLKDEIIALGG